MGQALSSCAPCCSGSQEYEDVEFYQKAVPNDKNLQLKEEIKTNDVKIVLTVDPKPTKKERGADPSNHGKNEEPNIPYLFLLFSII